MQAGFAMVESRFYQGKEFCKYTHEELYEFQPGFLLLFFFVGYGFMFGDSAGGFIGTSGFML